MSWLVQGLAGAIVAVYVYLLGRGLGEDGYRIPRKAAGIALACAVVAVGVARDHGDDDNVLTDLQYGIAVFMVLGIPAGLGLARGWRGKPWPWSASMESILRHAAAGWLARVARRLVAVLVAIAAIPLAALAGWFAWLEVVRVVREASGWLELALLALGNPIPFLFPLVPLSVGAGLLGFAARVWPKREAPLSSGDERGFSAALEIARGGGAPHQGGSRMGIRKAFAQFVILVGLALLLYYGLGYQVVYARTIVWGEEARIGLTLGAVLLVFAGFLWPRRRA
jgi:hypothetical protein